MKRLSIGLLVGATIMLLTENLIVSIVACFAVLTLFYPKARANT